MPKRAVWLAILFVSEMLTASAMGAYQGEIERAAVLAAFVPLIISGGGNSVKDVRSRLYFARVIGGNTPPPGNNAGNVEFVSTTYTIDENVPVGVVNVQLQRINGTLGPLDVTLATVDGTAVAGRDYGAVSTTVSWADGENQVITVSIPIINNSVVDGNRTFLVALSNPINSSAPPITQPALGFTDATAVTIVDDDFRRGVIGEIGGFFKLKL